MVAYNAGFKVDHTGNHAGCQGLGGDYMHNADRALRKLGLSPAAGKPPLSREELFAKAGVLKPAGGVNAHARIASEGPMSWGAALPWGALIVAVLLGVLAAAYFSFG